MRRPVIAAALIALALAPAAAQQTPRVSKELAAALAAPTRTPANTARDRWRNPGPTLTFFGVKPGQTVVELYPGGGWYTEILAPYMTRGALWVAPAAGRGTDGIKAKLASNPVYSRVRVSPLTAGAGGTVPPGSADVVLTFRNVHNWMMGDKPFADAVFAEAYRMLKPGGTLGIVEHRLPETADAAREKTSGYVKVSTVRRLAEGAGFRFAGASEINANPRDTADWPKGVWTLPPNYAEKDVDRAKYEAIGESDRMTLKFVKPRR